MRLFGQSQKVNSRNFRCAWFSEVRVPLATRQHPPRKTTMFAPKQAVCLLRRLRRQDPGCFLVLRSDFRKLAGALVAWGWTQTNAEDTKDIYCLEQPHARGPIRPSGAGMHSGARLFR